MAISDTYLGLQLRISDELGARTDLLTPLPGSNLTKSPIQNAIDSAIAKWEREPFYFNEIYDTTWFTTVIGQEFYTALDDPSIATMAGIYKVTAVVSGNRYTVIPRTWNYLADIAITASRQASWPSDYAYYNETVRLYPVPSGAIVMQVTGIQRFAALSGDSDANAWTEDAFDLIRCEAKLGLATEVLYDDDLAAKMQTAIYGTPQVRGYLQALKGESSRRSGRGTIKPTAF